MDGLRDCFAGRLLIDQEEMAPFLIDWRRRWQGRALAVAMPDSTADVASVVGWCAERKIAVVQQGGNTGLSGGSVPDESRNSVVLSLTRMNRVRAVDPAGNTMVVEAGCTLQQVQAAAEAVGRLFPLSLAAEGNCTIGGNLATNAGGVHVLRYGNARALCLGLEVVTASGKIWDGLRALRKDNTGYDLRDLFIGSEGTLGVITAAVLKIFPRPAARVVAFAAVPSIAAAVGLLQRAQAESGDGLSACELLSETCLSLVLRHGAAARRPLAAVSDWYVLLEISVWRDAAEAKASMLRLLEAVMEAGEVTDATVAESGAQAAALWALREGISDAQGAEGPTIKHDISLPIAAIANFILAADAAVANACSDVRLVVFGHVGDGNLHYNISPPADAAGFESLEPRLNRIVHDLVAQFGGSVSAEHGVGVLRREEVARYKSPVELQLMRAVKDALDPDGIMNPGKVLL